MKPHEEFCLTRKDPSINEHSFENWPTKWKEGKFTNPLFILHSFSLKAAKEEHRLQPTESFRTVEKQIDIVRTLNEATGEAGPQTPMVLDQYLKKLRQTFITEKGNYPTERELVPYKKGKVPRLRFVYNVTKLFFNRQSRVFLMPPSSVPVHIISFSSCNRMTKVHSQPTPLN